MAKLILGYLAEICPHLKAAVISEEMKFRWISDIRILPEGDGAENGLRQDVLYIHEKGMMWPALPERGGRELPPLVLDEAGCEPTDVGAAASARAESDEGAASTAAEQVKSEEVARAAGVGCGGQKEAETPDRLCRIYLAPGVRMAAAVQEIRDVFAENSTWQMELHNIAAFGGSIKEILDSAARRTPNHIYIANMSFKVLAYAGNTDIQETSATWRYQVAHGYLPPGVMKGMIDTGEWEALNHFHIASHMYSKNFYVPFATRNIFQGSRPQAHLFVVNITRRPHFEDLVIAETLGDFIENHYFLLSEFHLDRLASNFDAFFADVISGKLTDEKMIAKQILFFNWDRMDSYRMAVAPCENKSESEKSMLSYELESISRWRSFPFEKQMVFLLNEKDEDPDEQEKMLTRVAVKYHLSVCAGISYRDFMTSAAHYELLREIGRTANTRGEKRTIWRAEEYALPHLMDRIRADALHMELLHRGAGNLLAYDAAHDTDWFGTYLSFLVHDRNVVRTAEALHIHRNTLMYRLEKIRDITGMDEENFAERMHLLLSMMVLDQ